MTSDNNLFFIENIFKFHIFDKINQPALSYNGEFNFKPFYASLEGDLNFIDLDYLLSSNAIILQLLKTELLNNKNIDFSLKINAQIRFEVKLKTKNIVPKLEQYQVWYDSPREWKSEPLLRL